MRKNSYLFPIIVVLLACLLGIVLIRNLASTPGTIELSPQDEIKDFVTRPVSYDDNVYVLINGNVYDSAGSPASERISETILRITYYQLAHRIDPIMGLESVDTDLLDHTIQRLNSSVDDIASFYNDEQSRKEIGSFLYPVAFLAKLPSLEEKRRVLLTAPSPESARNYHEALADALNAYIEISSETSAFYDELQMRTAGQVYNTTAGSSDSRYYASALRALHDRALLQLRKEEQRYACLEGKRESCVHLTELFRDLTSPPSSPYAPPASGRDIPPHVRALHSLEAHYQSSFPGYGNTSDIFAITVEHSLCTPEFNPTYYHTWRKVADEDVPVFASTPINDVYFRDLRSSSELTPYFKKAEESGAKYLHQEIGQTYMCQDQGVVNANVATLLALRKKAAEEMLSQKLQGVLPEKFLRELVTLENRFNNDPLLAEEDMESYISLLAVTLQEGEQNLRAHIEEDTILHMESFIQIYRQQSPDLASLIGRVYDTNTGISSIWSSGADFPLSQLFMSRAAPETMFLSFNKSLTSVPFIRFTQKRQWEPLDRFHLISYVDFLTHNYTPREIEDIFEQSVKTHLYLQ